MYIEKINGPEDVKKLKMEQLPVLAEEMRHALLERASKHGGHFGPNFGMVEATIALHYVFESPKDKIGSNARYEIEHLLEEQVNLKLWVKVKKDWRDSDSMMKNFGYNKDEI